MKKDKELYRHIYNFVKLREMSFPSAYEYQEKYGLSFIEDDVEDAFRKGSLMNKSLSGRGGSSVLLYIFIIIFLILEINEVIPYTLLSGILLMGVTAIVYYVIDCAIDHIARRMKADYLYIVHTNSQKAGTGNDGN